jgi:hypothetical protein
MQGTVSEKQLRGITDRIVAAVSPQRIILIGAYGHGAPHEECALNLCVVVPEAGDWLSRAHELRKRVQVSAVALEPLVVTPGELESLRRTGNPLVDQALKEGKVLYERE